MNDLIKIALHLVPFTRRFFRVWLIALLFALNNNCALILSHAQAPYAKRSFRYISISLSLTWIGRWYCGTVESSDCNLLDLAMDLMNQHEVGPIKGKTNQRTSRTLSHDETAENERISLQTSWCAHTFAPFQMSSFNEKATRTFFEVSRDCQSREVNGARNWTLKKFVTTINSNQ